MQRLTGGEVAILVAAIPQLPILLGLFLHQVSKFRTLTRQIKNLDGKLSAHMQDHNDGPRANVWQGFYRKRRTGHT